MRAIHLNYHEITADPRVMKECTALADRGVDVTVICALEGDAQPVEAIGKLKVRRMRWMDVAAVTEDYIEEQQRHQRSYPHIKERFEKVLADRNTEIFAASLRQELLGDAESFLDIKHYKKHRGLKRIVAKYRGRFYRSRIQTRLAKPEFSRVRNRLEDAGLDVSDLLAKPHKKSKVYHSHFYQAVAFLFDANLRALNLDQPADIVHAHDIYTLPAGVALAKRLGAKLIYDAHEYEIERAAKMPPEGNAMADAIEMDCLEHTDAVITVSDGIRDLYSERFPKREPVVVLNAPDVTWQERSEEEHQKLRAAFRADLGLEQDTPLLAYTGWVLNEQRGLGVVAKALSLLPDFHLVVLGPRHERDDNNLLNMAEEVGVRDRIHLLPSVHHTQVVPTISACDVSIVPFQDATLSYRLAMPNKLFEGIFAGLPVCVSDLPDMRNFVEKLGRGRAMDPTDHNSIAETISYLYDHRSEFEMTEEQHKALVRDYSWSAQADKLEALYRELLQ